MAEIAEVADARTFLLNQCPEFVSPWEELRESWGEEDDIGIYNLFTFIINPFLEYALTDGYQRRHLRQQPEWKRIPTAPSPALDGLTESLFYVFEVWASSGDAELQNALRIELFEGASEEELDRVLALSGPALAAIATSQK